MEPSSPPGELPSVDTVSAERILAIFRERPSHVLTTKDVLDALGIGNRDKTRYNGVTQHLTRLTRRGLLRRPQGRKGLYILSEELSYGEVARRLRVLPPLLHGIHASAPSDAPGTRLGLLCHVPPEKTGPQGGNCDVWNLPFGANRKMTVRRHSGGWNATFGVTEDPLTPEELEVAVGFLVLCTGAPETAWTFTSLGINKDLRNVEMAGIQEVKWTVADLKGELLRVYQHEGRGVRVEAHTSERVGLRTLLAIISADGHAACLERLGRLEAVVKDQASVSHRRADAPQRQPRDDGLFCD